MLITLGIFNISKLYFLFSDTREKLKFRGAIVGTKSQICILGLRSYLITWICPKRRKRSDKP